jgi:hypothetical protein
MSKNGSINGGSMGRPSQVGSMNRSISSRSNPGTSPSVTKNASRIANNVKSMSSNERIVTSPSSTSSTNRLTSNVKSMSSKERMVASPSSTSKTNRLASNVRSMSSKERIVASPIDTRSKGRPGTSPADAKTVVGRIHSPIRIQPGTNKPETIGGRMYSGHALDRMQGRGIYPSVVENAIKKGQTTPGSRKGTTAHYDPKNKLTVITNASNGRVITTYPNRKR